MVADLELLNCLVAKINIARGETTKSEANTSKQRQEIKTMSW